VRKTIIVVDDCSTDGTRDWLKANFPIGARMGAEISIRTATEGSPWRRRFNDPQITIQPRYHERNRGKGAARRTGFAAVRGDVVVIQDADLE